MNILVIGPSIERSKGGTATVISEHLSNPIILNKNRFKYLISHVDGTLIEKIYYSVRCVWHILLNHKLYDIIHLHANSDISFYRKSLFLRVSSLLRKRTILHIHGHDFDSFYRRNSPALKKYIRGSLKRSSRILVLSDYWKVFFDKEFGELPAEILHNGINIDSYKGCRNRPTSFKNFLFLGRLGQRKGIYDLLKAIVMVVKDHRRSEAQFYLAGDGDLAKVQEIIDINDLNDNVKVLGWLSKEEKLEILKKSDAIVLPSYDENLPMSLIESMSCGKIVISTNVGGIPDLVQHEINGFLFDPGDVNSMVRYLLYAMDNPETMYVMADNNIETISNRFNLEILSHQLNSIYDSVKQN